jgi:hypothetical protein
MVQRALRGEQKCAKERPVIVFFQETLGLSREITPSFSTRWCIISTTWAPSVREVLSSASAPQNFSCSAISREHPFVQSISPCHMLVLSKTPWVLPGAPWLQSLLECFPLDVNDGSQKKGSLSVQYGCVFVCWELQVDAVMTCDSEERHTDSSTVRRSRVYCLLARRSRRAWSVERPAVLYGYILYVHARTVQYSLHNEGRGCCPIEACRDMKTCLNHGGQCTVRGAFLSNDTETRTERRFSLSIEVVLFFFCRCKLDTFACRSSI